MSTQPVSLAMVGFGNVGKAFARLLLRKAALIEHDHGVTFQVTGIATAHHGTAINAQGIDLAQALDLAGCGAGLGSLSVQSSGSSVADFVDNCPAQILLENSPVNHLTGQPAIETITEALRRRMHVVTANKGPVVHGYAQLNALAQQHHVRFLFESAVMDGAPIFSLFRNCLPVSELHGFTGVLNSCTNYILGLMEQGQSFEEAVRSAQTIGIAETDPSGDIDGWDAAIKVAALCTVLMGIPLRPQDLSREGIRGLTPEDIAQARSAGERWKLVCSAKRVGDRVETSVRPQRVPAGSPLYSVEGTSSFVQFETDTLPGLGILESNPSPDTTAFGLLSDVLTLVGKG